MHFNHLTQWNFFICANYNWSMRTVAEKEEEGMKFLFYCSWTKSQFCYIHSYERDIYIERIYLETQVKLVSLVNAIR